MSLALPRPGDPIVDETGRVVLADGHIPEALSTTVPSAKTYIAKKRRSLSELPAETKTQTVINAVLLYSLLGMTPNEIAYALGTQIADVEHIRNLEQYQDTFNLLFREIISANSSSLQARIQRYAASSVENMLELADYKPEFDESGTPKGYVIPPIVKFRANADILDRAGLSSDALFGKGSESGDENTLKIEVVEAGDAKTNININVKTGRR